MNIQSWIIRLKIFPDMMEETTLNDLNYDKKQSDPRQSLIM